MSKKLINGLKYEKLTEEQLCDLSRWELVDIILAYRKDYKRKEQECEELKNELIDVKWKIEAQDIELNYNVEQLDQLKAENKILKEKFEIAIKNNMDKTLLRLEKGDVQEELQEIREQFGIETLYCHVDNTRVHRCLDVLRLKDTLTEIKEIAEKYKTLSFGEQQYCYGEILRKISEVEDESNN